MQKSLGKIKVSKKILTFFVFFNRRAISFESLIKITTEILCQMKISNEKSEKLSQAINVLIDQIGNDLSSKWLITLETAKKQLENDLIHQGELITQQKDVK